jgi:hypothetical protein
LLVAAYQWYRASKVNVVPFELIDGKLVEVSTKDSTIWINALKNTLERSGGINASAACWTAASIGLGGVSTLLSAFQ